MNYKLGYFCAELPVLENLNTAFYDQLATHYYAVVDNAFPANLYQRLTDFSDRLIEEDRLRRAGIGSLGQFELNRKVRGDEIYWLQRNETDQCIVLFFSEIQSLIENLKREFFLSLNDAEFHFAHYPPGTFYRRHLDQFKGRNNRQISVILYLNDHWKPGDGGELKIYTTEGSELIAPVGNRLAVFRSDTVEHEVLPTHVLRRSVTGWLLNNPVGLGFLG